MTSVGKEKSRTGNGAWLVVAFLTAIPITAALHHAVFYRPTCILRPFGPDYHAEVVLRWIRNDPSPALAVLAAAAVWAAGLRVPRLRVWAAAFLLAFAPLSIWIWDVPFTGRIVHRLFHDGKVPLHTRHLYLAGVAVWYPAVILLRRMRRTGSRGTHARSSPA